MWPDVPPDIYSPLSLVGHLAEIGKIIKMCQLPTFIELTTWNTALQHFPFDKLKCIAFQ